MAITLAGPTTAITTSQLTAATYSFTADMANDLRSKAYVMTTAGGTQTGVTTHSVDAPKKVIFKKPAVFQQASQYNTTTGRYGKVPKNTTRIIGLGSAKVAANQWETIPITIDIGIPAGSVTYDRANVEASVLQTIMALHNQLSLLLTAMYDGIY